MIWTLKIEGPVSLRLKIPDNPILEHSGVGFSIWKVRASILEALQIVEALTEQGLRAEIFTETPPKD